MQNKSSKTAFSIVELSIVALIVSALIGLIISANRISENAKLTTARTLTKSSPVNDIDGLVAWYETTMPQSISDASADNGKSVTTWNDISPNKNNAVASVGPTYTSNVLNGLPVLRFGGLVTHCMAFNGADLVNSNYAIFIVEQRRAAGQQQFFGGSDIATDSSLNLGYNADTSLTLSQVNNNYTSVIAGYLSPTPRIHSYQFNSATGKNYYLNGTALALTSGGTNFVATNGLSIFNNVAFANAAIGCYTGSNNYFNGDIAEVIIFNKILNDTQRKDVEQYLGKKWGITVS